MLRMIGWLLKVSAFALVVLVAANIFKIGKRTVSDQIRVELSHAESATTFQKSARSWARQVTSDARDARDGIAKNMRVNKRAQALKRRTLKIVSEEIPSSERQKLRDLMRELNSSRASE